MLPICVRSHPPGLEYETPVGYEKISVRNVKGTNAPARTLLILHCLFRFPDYQRQDKCATRLPIAYIPRIFGFCSYQLINNYLTQ